MPFKREFDAWDRALQDPLFTSNARLSKDQAWYEYLNRTKPFRDALQAKLITQATYDKLTSTYRSTYISQMQTINARLKYATTSRVT